MAADQWTLPYRPAQILKGLQLVVWTTFSCRLFSISWSYWLFLCIWGLEHVQILPLFKESLRRSAKVLLLIPWDAVKRTQRYIKGTNNYGLRFSEKDDIVLSGYSDSEWAGDVTDRKSTSRYIFVLTGSPFSWCSRKQTFGCYIHLWSGIHQSEGSKQRCRVVKMTHTCIDTSAHTWSSVILQ